MKRLLLVLVVSCGGASEDTAPVTPAASIALFDPLPAPTPDVLRGVWGVKVQTAAGTADSRFRFADGVVTGGVRCTSSANLTPPFVVGQGAALQTTDLSDKEGELTLPAPLAFSEARSGVTCAGKFDAATWAFVITGTSMQLSASGLKGGGGSTLTKLGD